MTVIDDIWPEEASTPARTTTTSRRKGVPILFFFNGVHPDYHQATDYARQDRRREGEPDRADDLLAGAGDRECAGAAEVEPGELQGRGGEREVGGLGMSATRGGTRDSGALGSRPVLAAEAAARLKAVAEATWAGASSFRAQRGIGRPPRAMRTPVRCGAPPDPNRRAPIPRCARNDARESTDPSPTPRRFSDSLQPSRGFSRETETRLRP